MGSKDGARAASPVIGLAAAQSEQRILAPFGRRRCPVVGNEQIGRYRLVAITDLDGPRPLAGQFYMLAAARGWGDAARGERPYLARAFSVCRVREMRLEFLVDSIGPGTERLGTLAPGEETWLVGPLGIGFSPPAARALLVGGGIGIAPLVIWGEALVASGTPPRALLGFRDRSYADAAMLFDCEVTLATDDGSAGHRGLVTELVEHELERDSSQTVYACGPPPMLEAVRRICVQRGVPGQLALEAAMACGYGACFGCVVRAWDGYRRLCVDGPVVAAADLVEGWE